MKLFLTILLGLMVISSAASAASYTMRYYTGSAVAQISPIQNERLCHQLAKEKQFKQNQYYCLPKGVKWNYDLERDLGWR